jgi:hypothetical protein
VLENRSAAVALPSSSRVRRVELPKKQRSKRTNDPFAGIDTNTARGRRIADLVRAFLTELGDPAAITLQARAVAAAEMVTLAEEARAAALKGGGVDLDRLDRVIRLEGAVARSVRALGLPDRKREAEGPTLSDILAERYGGTEQAEDEPEGEAGIEGAAEETRTGEPPTVPAEDIST